MANIHGDAVWDGNIDITNYHKYGILWSCVGKREYRSFLFGDRVHFINISFEKLTFEIVICIYNFTRISHNRYFRWCHLYRTVVIIYSSKKDNPAYTQCE